MSLSTPRAASLVIISLRSLKNCYELTQWSVVPLWPTILRFFLGFSKNGWGLPQLDLMTLGMTILIILPVRQLKKRLGNNSKGLSSPRANYLVVIYLQTVKQVSND